MCTRGRGRPWTQPQQPPVQGAGWRRGAWPGGGGRGALTPRRRAGAALPAAPPCELLRRPLHPRRSRRGPGNMEPSPPNYSSGSDRKQDLLIPPPTPPLRLPPRASPSCYFLGTQIGFYENRRAESGSGPSRPFLPLLKHDMVLYARLTWRLGEEQRPLRPADRCSRVPGSPGRAAPSPGTKARPRGAAPWGAPQHTLHMVSPHPTDPWGCPGPFHAAERSRPAPMTRCWAFPSLYPSSTPTALPRSSAPCNSKNKNSNKKKQKKENSTATAAERLMLNPFKFTYIHKGLASENIWDLALAT